MHRKLAAGFSALLAISLLTRAQTVTLPDSICDAGSQVTKVSGSMALNFTEGPAVNRAGDLFFSEPNSSKIWKIPASGDMPTTPFIAASDGANGLAFDGLGKLVAAQQNKVTRFNADGSVAEVLAQSAGSLQLKNVNDLTFGTRGQLYFTNWDGGTVFYRDPSSGTTRVVAEGFTHSNGVFLVEEESLLFVNEDSPGIIYTYHVAEDGSLSQKTEFARANVTDGLRIDTHGNVYCASYGDKAIYVFNKSGESLGRIDLSAVAQYVTNCAFGGTDDRTLYITASNGVYAVGLKIPGRRVSTTVSTVQPRDFGIGRFRAQWHDDGIYTLQGRSVGGVTRDYRRLMNVPLIIVNADGRKSRVLKLR
jgi:gluconolactonase